MRIVSEIDASGLFAADVVLEGDQETPENCVEARPPDGFHAPKWTGSGWVEGRSSGEDLEELKAAKTEEIAAEAMDALAPLFTPERGRDETVLLVASHVLKLCDALKVPPDSRLREVVATGERALAKKAEVEAAGSVEELEAVTWGS